MTFPSSPSEAAAVLACPKCATPLIAQALDPLNTVDFCPDCKGMWLKRGVLGRSAGVARDIPDLDYSITHAVTASCACPSCGIHRALDTLRFARGTPLEIEYCRSCEGIFLDCRELPAVQQALRSFRAPEKVENLSQFTMEDPNAAFQISYDARRLNLLAVPTALLIGWISQGLILTKMLGWYVFEIPVHESGHAIAAWLGGRIAIPIGAFLPMAAFTVTMNHERSGPVYFLLVTGICAFAVWAWRRRHPTPAVFGSGLIAAATYFTWIASDERSQMFLVYGGLAGEFVLSTLLIIGFYYRLPSVLRWDFFRFIGLAIGSFTYMSALTLWVKVLRGTAQLPLGSFIDGRDSNGGDLQRLFQVYGWSQPELTRHFVFLGGVCGAVIAAHYFHFLRMRNGRPPRAETGRP